ncbi:MAG TPA: VWA domain-containing protein, partial [Acidobacteriota bacterium]|nr:VWA domain-containing protein [Acidobacteriota bacterium]
MFLTGNAIRTARTTVRCLAVILTVGLIASAAVAQAQDSVIVGPPDDPYVVYGSGLPTTYTPSKSVSVLSPPPVDAVNITLIDPSLFPEVCTSIEVLDSLGNPIPGLDVDSFCVYEDGFRIESFEVVETPIDSCFTSIALVIDVSGSMDNGDKLDSAKVAAHAFVDNMDLYDRVAIVKFSDCFEVVQDFTSDKTLLHTKITALVAGGFTAAFDGIWKGVDITTAEFGSKAVIALSDGMENRSWLCPGGTDGLLDGFADDSTIIVSLARAAGIPIYTISLGASFDPKYLEALALGSGGFHSHSPTAGEIQGIYETIKFRLCSRYVICYTSPDGPDTCHTLEVCSRNAAGVCYPCDTAEYCEPRPPHITLLVQAECHPANSDLHICARVNDSDTPRDSLDVKLFYRMSDADPYSSVAMVHTYLDTVCYVIPGDLVPSCLMDSVPVYATA